MEAIVLAVAKAITIRHKIALSKPPHQRVLPRNQRDVVALSRKAYCTVRDRSAVILVAAIHIVPLMA